MSPRIVIVGAGAVGGSLGGWLQQAGRNVTFLARGETAHALRARGLRLYPGEAASGGATMTVGVRERAADIPAPDVVLLAVKNYHLAELAATLAAAWGAGPLVIALQNGTEHRRILPPVFPRTVYGIVHYNAWADAPGVIGYARKGPLVLAAEADRKALLEEAARLFDGVVDTYVTDRLNDAVYSKLIVNLTSSLTTLVGYPARPPSDPVLFQKLMTGITSEGIDVVRAAGCREYKVPGIPTWLLMKAGAKLPPFLTRKAFQKNLAKQRINSMAQDIARGTDDTELETLTGHLLELAEKTGTPAPINRTVYELCRARFATQPFEPVDVGDVWSAVAKGPERVAG